VLASRRPRTNGLGVPVNEFLFLFPLPFPARRSESFYLIRFSDIPGVLCIFILPGGDILGPPAIMSAARSLSPPLGRWQDFPPPGFVWSRTSAPPRVLSEAAVFFYGPVFRRTSQTSFSADRGRTLSATDLASSCRCFLFFSLSGDQSGRRFLGGLEFYEAFLSWASAVRTSSLSGSRSRSGGFFFHVDAFARLARG